MTQFEIWKLVTDFGLLGSLVYFAYRFLRNQTPVNPHQMQELQNGLRGAIREADQAGKGLNEQLIQRKQNLEKLLIDLETAESRVNRAVNAAEESKGELEILISKTKQAKDEISYQSKPAKAAKNVDKFVPTPKEDLLTVEQVTEVADADEDDFSQAVNPTGRTNIFGEPIEEVANTYNPVIRRSPKELESAFTETPLTTQIEKEVALPVPAAKNKPAKEVTLEDVYAQAEDLLRAGHALEEVSKQTSLTSDEVRMLSQLMEADTALEGPQVEASQADNRLGVLAGFKRQTQVL